MIMDMKWYVEEKYMQQVITIYMKFSEFQIS